MGFDHEISEEAEVEMEKEEELLLKKLGWKGKGLIKSAYDAENDGTPHVEKPDGNSVLLLIFLLNYCVAARMHSSFISNLFCISMQ